ncbi:hypothetical protein E4T56_gene16823 [Termitomyces sp. T112]|nr:hypothetical protein E4T56_gene16823 [Termitomyces sp. T112]
MESGSAGDLVVPLFNLSSLLRFTLSPLRTYERYDGYIVRRYPLVSPEVIYRRVTQDGNLSTLCCVVGYFSLFPFPSSGRNPTHWVVVCLSGAFLCVSMILIYVPAKT